MANLAVMLEVSCPRFHTLLTIRNRILPILAPYDDPVFFVKPFTSKKVLKRQIGDYIFDHACLENEKDLKNLVPTIGDAGR